MRKALDFLKEVRVELQKVVWPSRRETMQLTIVVIMVTLLVGFFLGGIDLVLTHLTGLILK
jgi:preprotein translocase subunit SecE